MDSSNGEPRLRAANPVEWRCFGRRRNFHLATLTTLGLCVFLLVIKYEGAFFVVGHSGLWSCELGPFDSLRQAKAEAVHLGNKFLSDAYDEWVPVLF